MNPVQILLNANSPDGQTRQAAEEALSGASANLIDFMQTLVGVLADEASPPPARQMAAVVLKNTVAVRSKDAAKKAALEAKWRELPQQAREQLKERILASLGSPERNVRFTVALLVANLARIEIPVGLWDALLPKLCQVSQGQNDDFAEAALLTLAYICEETEQCEPLELAMRTGSRPILDAVFNCIQRPSQAVVFSAGRCLVFAMEFIKPHMADNNARGFIVNTLCQLCSSPDERTRETAMEGIFRFAELYYVHVPAHMDDLVRVTVAAIREHRGNEGAAIYALQFWSQICETEADFDPGDQDNLGVTHRVRNDLFQVMWQALQQQEEGQTNEDWNLSVAASRVLMEMGGAIREDFLAVAMDTAMQNVTANDWRVQDAAIVLFGCIVATPIGDASRIVPTVAEALPRLAAMSLTGHELVRDSAAWVLTQIAAYHAAVMLSPDMFGPVFNTIKQQLQASPQLAERALSCLHNLAQHVDDEYNAFDDDDDHANVNHRPPSNQLSPSFGELIQIIGGVLDAPHSTDNMRSLAQETLNVLIHAAATDVESVLTSLVPILCNKIDQAVAQRRQEGATPFLNMQIGLLCGAITALARKLGPTIGQFANVVLPTVHSTLQVPPARRSIIQQTTFQQEEAAEEADTIFGVESMNCLGALIQALGTDMLQHMNQFARAILSGLEQFDDEDVYAASLGTLGDCANIFNVRALDVVLMDGLKLLHGQLMSNDTPITIKPDILRCVGDIALYFGPGFGQFANDFLKIAQDIDTAARGLDLTSEDIRDEALSIFQAIAEFSSQVVQGMKENMPTILGSVPWMVQFVEAVGNQFRATDPDLLEKLVLLVGDVADALKEAPGDVLVNAQQALGSQAIQQVLQGACDFRDMEAVAQGGQWARGAVQKLMARRP